MGLDSPDPNWQSDSSDCIIAGLVLKDGHMLLKESNLTASAATQGSHHIQHLILQTRPPRERKLSIIQ